MSAVRFFVSYSRDVQQEIKPIVDLLRAAQYEVWWDAEIPPIADWWATILDEIQACQVFIFVVSEKSVQSPYCLAELAYATARNRPILPFIIDDDTKYTIPDAITPYRNQYFHYNGDPARVLDQIRTAVSHLRWGRYTDFPVSRPIEPNKGSSGSLEEEFQQAARLAESGHFDESKKRFRNVKSLDFDGWGDECDGWLLKLQKYEEIARLAAHKSTYERALKKWNEYRQSYGTAFDPLDLARQITKIEQPPAAVSEDEDAVPFPEEEVDESSYRQAYLQIRQRITSLIDQQTALLAKLNWADQAGASKALATANRTRTFNIFVIGQFVTGKSTLINALLGRKILPSGVLPRTRIITEIRWGDQERAVLHYKPDVDGLINSPEEIPIQDIERYISIGNDDGEILEGPYQKVELFYPQKVLQPNVVLVDTSGLNETSWRDEQVIPLLRSADILLFVISSLTAFGQYEEGLLYSLRQERPNIFLVCNKFDQVDPEDQAPLMQMVRNRAMSFDGKHGTDRIYFVSALEALRECQRKRSAGGTMKGRDGG